MLELLAILLCVLFIALAAVGTAVVLTSGYIQSRVIYGLTVATVLGSAWFYWPRIRYEWLNYVLFN